MSRNDLFLLLACAIVATILSGSPSPSARSSGLTIAGLLSPAAVDGAASDPALFQQSFGHQ